MSWSVSYIGTPEKIVEALEKYSTNLSGQSKQEFDAALPHIAALVNQNFGDKYLRKLSANGSGYTDNGELKSASVSVNLETMYSVLV